MTSFFKIFLVFFLLTMQAQSFAAVDFNDEPAVQSKNTVKSSSERGTGKNNQKLNFAENNPVAALLCKMIRAFSGTIAKTIAILMVIGLGISMLAATPQQPVTPVTIVSVIIGVGILFSAEILVGKLTGDAGQGGGNYKKSCDCKYGLEGECDENI